MNNIFKKNIESIYKKNPDFATRIAKHIPNDMPKLIAENNFYNFDREFNINKDFDVNDEIVVI